MAPHVLIPQRKSKANKAKGNLKDTRATPPLLRLPLQIRNRIYKYVLKETDFALKQVKQSQVLNAQRSSAQAAQFQTFDTSILLVNKQICHEALRIMYSENTFKFTFIGKNPPQFNGFVRWAPGLIIEIQFYPEEIANDSLPFWNAFFATFFQSRQETPQGMKKQDLKTLVLVFKVKDEGKDANTTQNCLHFVQRRMESSMFNLRVEKFAHFSAEFDSFDPHGDVEAGVATATTFCNFLSNLQWQVLRNTGAIRKIVRAIQERPNTSNTVPGGFSASSACRGSSNVGRTDSETSESSTIGREDMVAGSGSRFNTDEARIGRGSFKSAKNGRGGTVFGNSGCGGSMRGGFIGIASGRRGSSHDHSGGRGGRSLPRVW